MKGCQQIFKFPFAQTVTSYTKQLQNFQKNVLWIVLWIIWTAKLVFSWGSFASHSFFHPKCRKHAKQTRWILWNIKCISHMDFWTITKIVIWFSYKNFSVQIFQENSRKLKILITEYWWFTSIIETGQHIYWSSSSVRQKISYYPNKFLSKANRSCPGQSTCCIPASLSSHNTETSTVSYYILHNTKHCISFTVNTSLQENKAA